MQINNTELTQEFNAIFRDGQIYSEAQVKVIIQKQGTLKVREYTPTAINYYPNYCEVNYTVDGADAYKDGEEYMLKVVNQDDKLIYLDTLYISSIEHNAKKQNIDNDEYKTNDDNLTSEELEQQDSDNDYIILDN